MKRKYVVTLTAALGLTGCCGTGKPGLFTSERPACGCGSTVPPPGARLSPFAPSPVPAGAVPSFAIPPAPAPVPPAPPPTGGPVGRIEPNFRPIDDPLVSPAVPPGTEAPNATVRLNDPVPVQTNAKPPAPVATPMPPAADTTPPAETRDNDQRGPIDIPQFVIVKPQAANGHKPYVEGITWLKTNGYRTVLHLRAPGEDSTSARREFEKHGLQYVSLEVGPDKLTKDLLEQFNQIITDKTTLPLFIYDHDGSLTGSLWYLHFRMNGYTEDKALEESRRLGFRPEKDKDHQAMFNATRNLTAALKP